MAERTRVVVVGNGMVGHRFCERLAELDEKRELDVLVLGEESRVAYDRVHLSSLFGDASADGLALAEECWYEDNDQALHLGERVVGIDPVGFTIDTASGRSVPYDKLILATGSSPFVPPMSGSDLPGVFTYRTIEDVDAIRDWAKGKRVGAVIGGGLLGLEAAKALMDLGIETHVVEFAPRLMPRQVDDAGGEILAARIRELGVQLHLGKSTQELQGTSSVERMCLADGEVLEVDLVVISAGIRPNDELARVAGLAVGERGGVVVDEAMQTSDPDIYAIGEVALHEGVIYGLVAPGYEMAEVAAVRLTGGPAVFAGADMSTKLKLLGVDVASFGDPFASEGTRSVVFEDWQRGVYKKLVVEESGGQLRGGILVGDASQYGELLLATRQQAVVADRVEEVLFGAAAGGEADGFDRFADDAQICSCNNVSKADLCTAIEGGALALPELKRCTKAGTGCGGCLPLVEKILKSELQARGESVDASLCEHFAHARQELLQIIKIKKFTTFDQIISNEGRGLGCETCKPAIASILASLWNEPILEHASLQDTNDKFLANIQRGGTYSVIPRIPGGEITPDKLIVLGQVAKKYGLYCKITGGQRIDMLGARVEQLPEIWEELVEAGFESGHAYGKALRTVKSCVGTAWCRFAVGDSTGLAIRLEERYRGIRSPHKLKGAVSGCIRECAEAQSKDFGVIATDKGWNLYVGGNGGSNPRHAELLAADLGEEELIRLCDRYLMYYIHTADRLQRTARWIESLPDGLETLRKILIEDSLGVCEQLENDMQKLIDSYQCEWREVVDDPKRRAAFRHYAADERGDEAVAFVTERGQRRPADWPTARPGGTAEAKETQENPSSPIADSREHWRWVPLARSEEVPSSQGITARYGDTQIAIFNVAGIDEWYACQNVCPHMMDMVLARGIVGDSGGEPKVACPQHKRTFSLRSGEGLSDPSYAISTFEVKIEAGEVYVKLPPVEEIPALITCRSSRAA